MKLKKIFPLICLFSYSVFLIGQSEKYADSLQLEIKYAANEEKVELVKIFSREFYKVNPKIVENTIDGVLGTPNLTELDNAELYLLKGRAFYYQYDFENFSLNIGKAFNLLDNYDGFFTEYYHFLKYNQTRLQGMFKFHEGMPKEALALYIESVDHARASNDNNNLAKSLSELGTFFIEQEDYSKSLEYLNKSREVNIEHTIENDDYYTRLYSEIAIAYTKLNQLDSAKKYIDLVPFKKRDIPFLINHTIYYKQKGQNFKALALLDSLVVKVQKDGPKHWLPLLEMGRGDNYLELKQFEKAEASFLNARLEFLAINSKNNSAQIAERLYDYFRERGKFEKALTYHEEYKMMSDSMLFAKHSAVLKGLEDSNSLKLKEQENKSLKEQELSNGKIISRQRWLGVLGLICIGGLALWVYTYFKNSKVRKKLNNQLTEANNDLKEKNQKINSIANELKFVTENIPQQVVRLDDKFELVYYNDHFRNLFSLSSSESDKNVFKLLGFSNQDQFDFFESLKEKGKISFVWIPPQSNQVYQIQMVKTMSEEDEQQYLMVFGDITQLKEKEKARMEEMETTLKTMESNYEQYDQEKKTLNVSLENKKRELASKMMQISKRNGDLERILGNLKEVYGQSNSTTKTRISKVISQLNDVLDIEDGWSTFIAYFEEVHPSFLKELQSRCSELSNNELRHCTFIKLGLSNKEVADMLNVSNKTVEVARYRIKKKLNLGKEDSLSIYLTNIE